MKWRWFHGAAFYVAIEGAAFGMAQIAKKTRNIPETEREKDEFANPGEEYDAIYRGLKQPFFAPPGAVFVPIWALNWVLAIWGLIQVLNLSPKTLGRREFLAAHGVFWLTYLTFTAAYFSQRSPIKGAILTSTGLLASLFALGIALFRLKHKKVALSFVTLVPWLLIATPTAICCTLEPRRMVWNWAVF